MLEKVKAALKITSNVFDTELTSLIDAAKLDLGVAGVVVPDPLDALVEMAIITYCRMNFSFGVVPDYDKVKRSYDEQKAQLSMATGYTTWSE